MIKEQRQYHGGKIVGSTGGTEIPSPVDIHVKKGALDADLKGALDIDTSLKKN